MFANHEIIPAPEETEPARGPAKWLQYLFYVHFASLILSLTGLFALDLAITPWISRILIAANAAFLYMLASTGSRYRQAAILTAVSLVLQIVSLYKLSSLLTTVSSVLTIVACYQEFYAHAELVAPKDQKLSRQWQKLFIWQFVIGIISGLVSVTAVVIMVLVNMEQTQITQLIMSAIILVSLIPGILYLVYLRRTISLIQE